MFLFVKLIRRPVLRRRRLLEHRLSLLRCAFPRFGTFGSTSVPTYLKRRCMRRKNLCLYHSCQAQHRWRRTWSPGGIIVVEAAASCRKRWQHGLQGGANKSLAIGTPVGGIKVLRTDERGSRIRSTTSVKHRRARDYMNP